MPINFSALLVRSGPFRVRVGKSYPQSQRSAPDGFSSMQCGHFMVSTHSGLAAHCTILAGYLSGEGISMVRRYLGFLLQRFPGPGGERILHQRDRDKRPALPRERTPIRLARVLGTCIGEAWTRGGACEVVNSREGHFVIAICSHRHSRFVPSNSSREVES
jgi:hypothetical protein